MTWTYAAEPAFATSPFATWRLSRGRRMHDPAPLVHAKRMGSLVALCGELTTSWHKFWDLPFTAALPGACPACVRRLGSEPRPAG